MREILFRGKRIDNGEWVEGYYCGKVNKTIFIPDEDSAQIIDKDLYWHEITPETVGQYTGLTDENERQCRVCGRTFFPAVEADWVYRVHIGNKYPIVCSYSCMIKGQREADEINAESQRRRVERRQKTIAARR